MSTATIVERAAGILLHAKPAAFAGRARDALDAAEALHLAGLLTAPAPVPQPGLAAEVDEAATLLVASGLYKSLVIMRENGALNRGEYAVLVSLAGRYGETVHAAALTAAAPKPDAEGTTSLRVRIEATMRLKDEPYWLVLADVLTELGAPLLRSSDLRSAHRVAARRVRTEVDQ